jgi:hypothetical protein
MQIGTGFWASKTLLSAVELELFTVLGNEHLPAAEIGDRLGLPRGHRPTSSTRSCRSGSSRATATV